MSVRKKYDQRCDVCYMKTDLCLCDLIPKLEMTTKLIVIVGKREFSVPTNTGRLATLAIKDSVTLIRGDLDRPYELKEHLPDDYHPLLLYPAPEADLLTYDYMDQIKKPCVLIVPDGNWRQANKMRRRDLTMSTIPIVKIAPGQPTQYKVRKESQAEGLATIEAIARALGVIEGRDNGPRIQAQLEQLLNVMVSRTLASRGVM